MNIEKYLDKIVSVNYNNEELKGHVVETYSTKLGKQGIIIQDEKGNFKHIKFHDLDNYPKIIEWISNCLITNTNRILTFICTK